MAGTQSEDQIKMFQILLLLWICNQLSIKRYINFNTLLHDARVVEGIKKENAIYFPYWDKPTYNQSNNFGCMALTSISESENAYDNGATGGSSGQQRSYSNPVAIKPTGWTGQWHKPQANSLKLTDTDCETLSKQERC